MKIELDLPETIVKDLRDRSTAKGQSVAAYAAGLVRKSLRDEEQLSANQRQAIDARVNEGVEDLIKGRAYGPFATHAELMACLRGARKKSRSKRTPG